MSSRLLALLAALSLGAAPARPARDKIELRWHAPPACPDEASIRAAIERHVGRPLSEIRDRRLSIIATAHPTDTYWSLTIYTVDAEGTQERSLRYNHGCSLLADAAAVLIAMTIDPQVLGRLDPATLELITGEADQPPNAPSSEPEPAPPPADVAAPKSSASPPPDPPASAARALRPEMPTAPSPSSPPRRRLEPRGAVRLAGSLGWGDLPSTGGGLDLALAVRVGRFQAELAGASWFLRSVKLNLPGSSGAVFDLWRLALRGGYVVPAGRRLEVPLLVGIETGQIHVRGVQLVDASNTRTPWLAVALSPALAILPHPSFAVVLGLEVVVPVTRPRFVVENAGEIFRPRSAGLRAFLGLEFRFPDRRSRSR